MKSRPPRRAMNLSAWIDVVGGLASTLWAMRQPMPGPPDVAAWMFLAGVCLWLTGACVVVDCVAASSRRRWPLVVRAALALLPHPLLFLGWGFLPLSLAHAAVLVLALASLPDEW